LLYALWLVDRDGLPITQIEFHHFQVNPILFSGFISALFNFSVELGAGVVKEVEMGTSKLIIYYYSQGILLVLAVSKSDKTKKYESLIQTIGERVISKYDLRSRANATKKIDLINKELWSVYREFKEKELKYEFDQIPLLQNPKVAYLLKQMIHGHIVRIKPEFDKNGQSFIRYSAAEKILEMTTEDVQFILNELVAVGIMKKIPYLTLSLCPNCKSADVYPILKCPKCKHGTVIPERLYEHFICGYIGPKSQFVYNNELICPKCQKKLVTLGDDFREVEGYRCVDCNNVTTEPLEVLFCNNCGATYFSFEGEKKVIYTYILHTEIIDDLNEYLLSQTLEKRKIVPSISTVTGRTPQATVSTKVDYYEPKQAKSKFQIIKEIAKIREELVFLNRKVEGSRNVPKDVLRRKKELTERLRMLEQWIKTST